MAKKKDPVKARVAIAVEAAIDRKGLALQVLEVRELTSIGDYFILCSGTSERQTQAIAEAIETNLRERQGVRPLLVEGTNPGRWILLDYGDFIAHVFTEDTRRFYGLERLWGDAPNVTDQFTSEPKTADSVQRI